MHMNRNTHINFFFFDKSYQKFNHNPELFSILIQLQKFGLYWFWHLPNFFSFKLGAANWMLPRQEESFCPLAKRPKPPPALPETQPMTAGGVAPTGVPTANAWRTAASGSASLPSAERVDDSMSWPTLPMQTQRTLNPAPSALGWSRMSPSG